MSYEVEKDWITKAGFRAVVLMIDLGHRCGYIGLPKEHALYGKGYGEPCDCLTFPEGEQIGKRGVIPIICSDGSPRPDVVFDIHGGLTYAAGKENYPVESDGLWWFGFDCGHAGDSPSPKYLEEEKRKYPDKPYMWQRDGQHRSLAYCITECESLAQQMISRVTQFESMP